MSNSQIAASLLKRQRCLTWEGSLAGLKRGWACIKRTNTWEPWLQMLCAAQEGAGGLLDGASHEQGATEKQPFLFFNPLLPAMHPGTAHPSPLPCPPPHLTGFRLDRTPHTGTSQCLNKSQFKARLKLSEVSSISSHALKNQESLRSCSEALPTDAVRSVAQLLSIYKENVLKYPLVH